MPAVEMVRACTHQYSHVRTIMLQVHFSTVYTANIATLNFQPTQCNTVRIHDTDNLLFWRNRTQMCTHTLIFCTCMRAEESIQAVSLRTFIQKMVRDKQLKVDLCLS